MADTPTPRSYPQILGDMMDAFLSRQGINGLRVGSPIVSIMEAAAQSDMRNSQDIFNLLTSTDLDNATGLALSRIGDSERVPKLEVAPASGIVTISDTSFTKKSTRLFQGASAPIVGTTTLHVVSASDWTNTGNLYVGRGTNNYEGPLAYTARTNVGTHWTITLASGTTKFHNVSETVILAQGGNRVIGPNAIVRTPQANVQNAIEFRTLFSTTLPDGEDNVTGVSVVAEVSGQIGNVIATAIKEFATSPFSGAAVTNPNPFTNGRETESDDEYRERIRDVRASRQLGTTLAITTAVTGITAPDENKRINSANLVKRFGFPATLYIDDGTGYEERTAPVAIESLTDDAVGGESYFETTQRPIARAFAISKNTAPFVLRPTDQLSVKVGGVTFTHSFNTSQFHSISNASAYEVVASINSNPDVGFVARTADSGTKVIIFANSDTNEDIEVVTVEGDSTDGNDGLGFPAGVNYTMRLFRNDRLLVKDGIVAAITSLPFAQWDAVVGDQTLELAIDHTPSLSFSFEDQDFIDAETGYATLGRNSLVAWAAVINAKIPGVTATENAGRLVLTSNAGPVAKARIEITGGSLVTAHFFGLDSADGAPRDYTLDRNEAQIVLTRILEAGDRLTAGSQFTRSFVESDSLAAVTLADEAKLWWVVDGDAEIIEHGVTPATILDVSVSETHAFGNLLTIDAGVSEVFTNVRKQDWMVLWDDELPDTLKGVFRIADSNNTSVTIERHTALAARSGHRTVALPGSGASIGKVLTCGGGTRPRGVISPFVPAEAVTNAAEIYDPNTKITTPVAPMNQARTHHTATVLANGKVVVVGGGVDGSPMTSLASIETYDPVADSWTNSGVSLTSGVRNHSATLLTDGRILIAGGINSAGTVINSYQIYSPSGDTISAVGTMVEARMCHSAVKITSNQVLVAGGINAVGVTVATAELFTPGADTFAATGSMGVARHSFGMEMVGLAPTVVLAIGNHFGTTGNDSWETYSIGGGTWSPGATEAFKFENKNVVRISNGHVVGLDGFVTASPVLWAGFTYDGATMTQLSTPPLSASEDGSARWDSQYVELKDGVAGVENLVASVCGSWQHSTAWSFQGTAILEVYDEVADTWDSPDPAVVTPLNLLDIGIAFVRTDSAVQETVVPAGTNYTASSLVDVLNGELTGATAYVYKTTKLRVATNTFSEAGDIALVAEDLVADALLLEPDDATSNLTPHVGATQTQSSGLGTPSFEDVRIVGQSKGDVFPKPVVTSVVGDVDYSLVGLRNWIRGADGTSPFDNAAYYNFRANNEFKFNSQIVSRVAGEILSVVETREEPNQPWGAVDRAYLASAFSTGVESTLEVLVDNNDDKRFSINMYRNLQTVGTTYTGTNDFKDSDGGGASLAETFGLEFDFNDMAVYMRARAMAFSSDADRRMLFRYFRLGPDGDDVRVRFGNPDAPDSELAVATEMVTGGFTNVTVKLRSGALRAPTVHNTTRLGRAVLSTTAGGTATILDVLHLAVATAQRTTNVTTLTLTLPFTITNHGFLVGDQLWVESSDVNFSSGLKTITARTNSTIAYSETAADAGPTASIGTVSFDSQGEATFAGSSTIAGDYLHVLDPTRNVVLFDLTFQVASVANGYVTVLSGDQFDGTGASPSTVLVWPPILDADNFQIFENDPQTVTEIVAAINALADADSSTVPIRAVSTGTGSDLVEVNSPDDEDDAHFWYTLADGVNWVRTTTPPVSIAGDYTLEFKNTVTGSLATNSDWVNEEVRIVPITTQNVVDWMNIPTISGLFTVADIEASTDGQHVQISTLTAGSAGGVEVQGGLANNATIPVVGTPVTLGANTISTIAKLDGDGFTTRMWCRIENENPLPKLDVLTAGKILSSWDAAGLLTFTTPIVNVVAPATQTKLQVERQGRFIAISDMGMAGNFSWAGVYPGCWLRVSAATTPTLSQVSAANQGLFRVLRVVDGTVNGNAGTIWIENTSAIEEFSEGVLTVYGSDSVMPGDQLVILDDTWGVGNIGTWSIKSVGTTTADGTDSFTSTDTFAVDASSRAPIAQGTCPALGSDGLIFVREGTPCVYVMRVDGITLNQDDGDFLDVRWDQPVLAAAISAAAGSVISVLDKLDFPLEFVSGADGYRYDTGLLREANKVVYGDPSDSATYPGVAAADSHINIQGPLVKRIQVSLSVRVKSGLNSQDIANRVRSAVATVVNKTPIGQSIAFSDIIDAAHDVVGVTSVTIVAPLFAVGNDQIQVQPYEKPFVIDLTQDVQVSFVGL